MCDDNSLRGAGNHPFNDRGKLVMIADKGRSQVARSFSIRCNHTDEPVHDACQPSMQTVAFEILDEVGQYQRRRRFVKEDGFLKCRTAAGNTLVNHLRPFFGRGIVQIIGEYEF